MKPREFWIAESKHLKELSESEIKLYESCYDDYDAVFFKPERVYHLIEHSAYEQLQAQCKKLVEALRNLKHEVWCDNLHLDSSSCNCMNSNLFYTLKEYEEFKKEQK